MILILSHRVACSLLNRKQTTAFNPGSKARTSITSMMEHDASPRRHQMLALLQKLIRAGSRRQIALPVTMNREDVAAGLPILNADLPLLAASATGSVGTGASRSIALSKLQSLPAGNALGMVALATAQTKNSLVPNKADLQLGQLRRQTSKQAEAFPISRGHRSSVTTGLFSRGKASAFPVPVASALKRTITMPTASNAVGKQTRVIQAGQGRPTQKISLPAALGLAVKPSVSLRDSTRGLSSLNAEAGRREISNPLGGFTEQTALQLAMAPSGRSSEIEGPVSQIGGARDVMLPLVEPAVGSNNALMSASDIANGPSSSRGRASKLMDALQQRAVPASLPQAVTAEPKNGFLTGSGPADGPANRGPVGRHASQASEGEPGFVVNLTGDVIIDGRRLGRITASSQAREASLPARGPSRVNLRAVPLYSGTQIPG